jgi:hypothetical protein
MSKPLPHVLLWSREHQYYELHMQGQLCQHFHQEDEMLWQEWLQEHTAFAFEGQAGRLSVHKEARVRGSGYWYAYRTKARHTSKRYLGHTTNVTFARLEQVAKALHGSSASVPLAPLPASQERAAYRPGTTREEDWTPVSHLSEQHEQRGALLSLSEQGGYVRTFLNEGKPMQRLLKALLDSVGPITDEAALRLDAAGSFREGGSEPCKYTP